MYFRASKHALPDDVQSLSSEENVPQLLAKLKRAIIYAPDTFGNDNLTESALSEAITANCLQVISQQHKSELFTFEENSFS